MFFGAGNVIFPPFLGLESGSQWVSGFAAYFIADIGLAMLAMFALLRVGSSEAVVSRVGQIPAAVLMSAIILCVGPMVAIPRTSATTYEMAIVPNLSGVSPVVFSILFFALILALCIRESAVVDIVGKILTPLLLLGLFAIIIKGVITPLGEPSALPQIANVAVTGIKAGYQTMDALAALPFGIIVLQSVTAKGYDSGRKQFRVVGGSAVLAGILLLAVYMGLAYLGATVSAQYTNDIGRAQLIMVIIEALMGKVGMVLFGVVVGLACVTTAVALTSSAAAYFTELCRGKVSYKVFVIAICVFSAVVSNLGLDRIVAVAAPVLDVIYPPTPGADLHLPAGAPSAGPHQPRRRHRRPADQRTVYPHRQRRGHSPGGEPAPVRSGPELADPRRRVRSGRLPAAEPCPQSGEGLFQAQRRALIRREPSLLKQGTVHQTVPCFSALFHILNALLAPVWHIIRASKR